jgi:hypothetical protein
LLYLQRVLTRAAHGAGRHVYWHSVGGVDDGSDVEEEEEEETESEADADADARAAARAEARGVCTRTRCAHVWRTARALFCADLS